MTGSPLAPMAGCMGQLIDVGLEILFVLPALLVEALQEIALVVEQADADERNAEIGGALDVVAREHAQAAGVDGQRFVQSEFGGEVGDRARTQHAGMWLRPRCGLRCRYSCWRR